MDSQKNLEMSRKAYPNHPHLQMAYMLGLEHGYKLHKDENPIREKVKQLWHRGDKKPANGKTIIMINTTKTVCGKYNAGDNTVRNWYDLGKYKDYNFTPKCYWAYLNHLRGKDVVVYEYYSEWKSERILPFGKED